MLTQPSFINKLNLTELNAILRNISLGKAHLEKILTEEEMRQLVNESKPNNQQEENLKSDKQEKTGRAALAVSTIITSCIGGWLGITAYSRLDLSSEIAILIVILTFALGGVIALLSYNLTKKQAEEVYIKQKILNIEIHLINIIIKKRELIIKRIEKKIIENFSLFFDKTAVHLNPNFFITIVKTFSANKVKFEKILIKATNLKNESVRRFYQKSVNDTIFAIEKIISKLINCAQYSRSNNQPTITSGKSYVNKLARYNSKDKKNLISMSEWIKNNIPSVLLDLMPTVLGGFSSMFVLIDGVPSILSHYNIHFDLSEVTIMSLKVLGLLLSAGLTVYYGYSVIHNSYKTFCRGWQLENDENNCAELYVKLIRQFQFYRLLIKLKSHTSYLKLIYKNLDVLENVDLF